MAVAKETPEEIARRFHARSAQTVLARVRPSRSPIAISRVISNNPSVDEKLRAAQIGLRNIAGVFGGPDTDAIYGPDNRFDDCHFSAPGLARHAQAWVDAITAADALRAQK